MNLFLQLLLNGFINGCVYALVALGFALICNTTRIFHFAHAGVYTFSAYVFYTFYTQQNLPLAIAIPLTLGIAAVLGIAIDCVLYKPLEKKNASTLLAMLSSLGLYIIIVNIICMFYGNNSKILVAGLLSTVKFGGLMLNVVQIAIFATFIIVFAVFSLTLYYTGLGIKLRAMRDNPTLLALNGVNANLLRLFVFGIGSSLCALAAILTGLDVGIDPNIGMSVTITAAVAMIAGGMGVFEGAALGALMIGVLQSLAVWQLSVRWQDMVTFIVLILFLLLRPQGLLGRKGRLEERGNV
ncbi:MAG: branched-chain amino acid ABC transporter permease [Deltaproteobacteria bacterium]|jgi:branched-chain amino acid transport system permease protein|nr:branched-chain amino acid ABC transporter permease [Deltaproteobacteria bacterium]